MWEGRMPDCCTLPGKYNNCSRKGCTQCGWNRDEQEWRRLIRQQKGMTKGTDGVSRLILPTIKERSEDHVE